MNINYLMFFLIILAIIGGTFHCLKPLIIKSKIKKIEKNKIILNLISKVLKDNNIENLMKNSINNSGYLFSYSLKDMIFKKINYDDTVKAIDLILKDLSIKDKFLKRLIESCDIKGFVILDRAISKYTVPYYLTYIDNKNKKENEKKAIEEKRLREIIKSSQV